MKYQKVLFMVLVLLVIIPIGIYFGFEGFDYWRETLSVLSLLFGLVGLILLLSFAHKHDQANHLREGMLDAFGEEIEIIYCDNCNETNKRTDLFCKKCNYDLRIIVCPICGNENPYNQHYCLNCDSILQNEKVHS
ncbi:MAG: hypothetical protein KJ847_00855 [Firmicutes bacterium]|nr:hypothetical protein [Bacillota bacterium]